MSKKIVGLVAGSVMLMAGSAANAALLTPDYSGSTGWQTFSYSYTYDSAMGADVDSTAGLEFSIGVSDVFGATGGNSILQLRNFSGITYKSAASVGTVAGSGTEADPLLLQTGDGLVAGANQCASFVYPDKLGGDCSQAYFTVNGYDYLTDPTINITFDWWMSEWDAGIVQDANQDTMKDFAFVVLLDNSKEGDVVKNDKYIKVAPSGAPDCTTAPGGCKVPEPSSLALMAIGLLGAGMVARRRQRV